METKNAARNAIRNRRKVYYKYARRKHDHWVKHPVIRLTGAYLKKYGFNCGDVIEISFSKGRIVIKKLQQ